jgi:hypothetical protein
MLIDGFVKLNRLPRATIFVALVVIATLKMYDWIVAPHLVCLFASQQYDSVVSKAVEKNRAVTRQVKTKTAKLEELHQRLAGARSILFASNEAAAFFSDLQPIAEEAGCTVDSLNLGSNKSSSRDKRKNPEDTSGIISRTAMLSVKGRYNNVLALVEKLQKHRRKIWLDSFEMKIIDFNSAQLKCDMTITIYTIQNKGTVL